MSASTSNPVERKRWLRVRPTFIFGCVVVLIVFFLPDAIRGRHGVQRAFLISACVAILLAWFFLLRYREWKRTWRGLIALGASLCLTVLLPIFLFELSQTKGLMRHPLHHIFSTYTWICIHWTYQGYLLVLLGVAGSFLGWGRARIAFVAGSLLLLVLRASMGTWVY